jgi:putative zinc finger/helix-turn-helix YgiT family protein
MEFCVACGDDRPIRREQQQVEYDVRGEKIAISLPVKVCDTCGTVEVDEAFGQDPVEQAYAIYRQRKGLLTPEQIEETRKRYHLSQKTFAALLGMSEATINRYEGGGLQDGPHDVIIRACVSPEFMRQQLELRGDKLSPRQRQRVEAALQRELGVRQHSLSDSDVLSSMPNELSLTTGFRRFSYERYVAVVLWLCRNVKTVTVTSLNKFLFYADFLCYKVESRSITGAAYRRMTYGPVPADYSGLRDRMELDGFIEIQEVAYQNGNVGEEYRLGPKADECPAHFSPQELRVLKTVAKTLGSLTPSRISERSHQESVWINTADRQLLSYQEARDLSLSLADN